MRIRKRITTTGPYQDEESLRLAEELAERFARRERALALLQAAFAADRADHDP